MVTAAEATENSGIVAHAYYMRSVAETSTGSSAGGQTLAAVADAAATAARSPTARAQAEYACALAIERTDATRALELLESAIAHADEVDSRWIRAFALTESLWLRARHGEPYDALHGYRDVVDTWFRGGDWANQWLSLRYIFAILESLGEDEAAAVLFGALDEAGVMATLPLEPANADAFARAAEQLAARLGAAEFSTRAASGRAMRDEEVVRHALLTIEKVTSAAP
jgi:hypothetical protein